MPLKKCSACGKEVSTQAAACPNSGHPVAKSSALAYSNPDPKIPKQLRLVIISLAMVGGLGVVINGKQTSNSTTQSSPSTPAAPPTATTPPIPLAQADLCRSDWTKCAEYEQVVNRYSNWSDVQVECQ